jgi:hypothetical protein
MKYWAKIILDDKKVEPIDSFSNHSFGNKPGDHSPKFQATIDEVFPEMFDKLGAKKAVKDNKSDFLSKIEHFEKMQDTSCCQDLISYFIKQDLENQSHC